ncbi:hypothetical protein RP20_CCG003073 [Aedes albopictus]|nr:hypothetical protein RP20_CCG003073 [Aedes albopictus]
MAPVYTQNEALNALFEQIMNVHWNFLETDESMQKIKLRQDLEDESHPAEIDIELCVGTTVKKRSATQEICRERAWRRQPPYQCFGRPATHCDGRWTVDDGRLTVAGPWVDAGSEGSSVCPGRTNCMRADQGWCHVGRNVDDDRCTEIMRGWFGRASVPNEGCY